MEMKFVQFNAPQLSEGILQCKGLHEKYPHTWK